MNGTTVTESSSSLWMRLVFGRNPKRTLLRLICLVLVSLVVFRFVLIPIRVTGTSMTPTFGDGKVTLINHQAYRFTKPKRGDVIAFRVPEEGDIVLLKRIIGLPRERVSIIDGQAYINGKAQVERYARTGKDALSTPKEYQLDEDQYFVMGDNREVSVYKIIPEHYILGKVLF